ncbi:hypothetical protein CASFOL_028883 [Castilleja foliolosa]|uniref:SHSP domain-containing protein n=1 Tax=Castilleja foliolosa TaxID=1961234 RepID=A0ABD3CFH7_9LAMI
MDVPIHLQSATNLKTHSNNSLQFRKGVKMEIPIFFLSTHFPPSHLIPQNYVQWTQTIESHIYSAEIPGVRKEQIRLEVEDSRYIIIQTDAAVEPSRSFHRKFRLPRQVYVNGISAEYVTGVLTVTVPRSLVRMDPAVVFENVHLPARAA